MILQVFLNFLYLGCISFGGPAAHIGYFRRVFVEQKSWLSDQQFASHLALCQFLPGPSSSQLGFAIAYQRGGIASAIAAFLGFTLPSFLLMYALAAWHSQFAVTGWQHGVVSGLKLLAVVVVADAIWTMSKQFCSQRSGQLLAVFSAVVLAFFPFAVLQWSLMVGAALWMAQRQPQSNPAVIALPKMTKWLIGLFLALLLLCFVSPQSVFAIFYRAGSLVFGGGHVVLPLLQNFVDGTLSDDQFLLGYAAAQAMPGPMFSLSSYLGAAMHPEAALTYALIACVGVFLPGFLLVLAFSSSWQELSLQPRLQAAVAGVNAVAVGMLAAAWWNPVLSSAPHDLLAIFTAALGLLVLRSQHVPTALIVLAFAGFGVLVYG